MDALDGRVVLVTGGARRVGAAIARRCAAAGADVALHYRSSRTEADALAGELAATGRRVEAFGAELTDAAAAAALMRDVVERFGGLDVLVNNAAVFERCAFTESDDEAWERAWRHTLDVNLIAPARMARLAAPHLRARRGVVVSLIDIAATRAWTGYAHHCAAKAGLAHLTRVLAVELAPEARAVGVAPGIALWPDGMPDDERERLLAKTTLQRAGTPDDVADAVVFLAAQSYTTGAIIPVDGGWHVPR